MGQTIGWYRFTEDKSRHEWAKDVPDYFDMKFDGRWEWFQAIWEVPHERVFSGDDAMFRPTDFVAFRERLSTIGLLVGDEEHEVFREMTDYLEAHPDVYVEYS
jgi:hypothetical protein